jgi:hypothetical protein
MSSIKTPTLSLSDDRKTMLIEFPGDPPVTLACDAGSVDALLRAVSQLRSQMTPPYPEIYAPSPRFEGIANPRWYTEPVLMPEGSAIHFRHPGFGWLCFCLSKEDARTLAARLQAQVARIEEAPTGPRN